MNKNQFEIIQQNTINNTVQDWIQLSQSNEDFQMLFTKEHLQQLIHLFQIETNEKAQEYFYQQSYNKIMQMDNEYKYRYANQSQNLQDDEYRRELDKVRREKETIQKR